MCHDLEIIHVCVPALHIVLKREMGVLCQTLQLTPFQRFEDLSPDSTSSGVKVMSAVTDWDARNVSGREALLSYKTNWFKEKKKKKKRLERNKHCLCRLTIYNHHFPSGGITLIWSVSEKMRIFHQEHKYYFLDFQHVCHFFLFWISEFHLLRYS